LDAGEIWTPTQGAELLYSLSVAQRRAGAVPQGLHSLALALGAEDWQAWPPARAPEAGHRKAWAWELVSAMPSVHMLLHPAEELGEDLVAETVEGMTWAATVVANVTMLGQEAPHLLPEESGRTSIEELLVLGGSLRVGHCQRLQSAGRAAVEAAVQITGAAYQRTGEPGLYRVALGVLGSIRPLEAAQLLRDFVNGQPKPAPLDLLWTAYAQLQGSYASVAQSRGSVDLFLRYTRLARQTAEEGSSTALVDVFRHLQAVPHWRLGFSGPCGHDIAQGLSDWTATVRRIAPYLDQPVPFRISPPSNKVRVGFASSWFCNSAIGKLMLGLVEGLDKKRFHVTLLRVTPLNGEPLVDEYFSRDFDKAADQVVPLSIGSSQDPTSALAEAREALATASLDVLVWCDVGMDPATYYLALQRAAPIQAVFWGHPFTAGLGSSVDYYLLPEGAVHPSPVAPTPPQDQEDLCAASDTADLFHEQVLRLSTLGAVFEKIDVAEHWASSEREDVVRRLTESGALLGATGGMVEPRDPQAPEERLYGCLQHCGKFHPSFDSYLTGILEADRQAVLVVRQCGQGAGESFLGRLRKDKGKSLLARRVWTVPALAYGDFLALLGAVDVFLEPMPFPASITSLDSFMVGTPVVAHGNAIIGRGGLALSKALYHRLALGAEVEQWVVADDKADFIAKAVTIANRPELRRQFQSALEKGQVQVFSDDLATKEWESLLVGLDKFQNHWQPPESSYPAPATLAIASLVSEAPLVQDQGSRAGAYFAWFDWLETWSRQHLAPSLSPEVQESLFVALGRGRASAGELAGVPAILEELAGLLVSLMQSADRADHACMPGCKDFWAEACFAHGHGDWWEIDLSPKDYDELPLPMQLASLSAACATAATREFRNQNEGQQQGDEPATGLLNAVLLAATAKTFLCQWDAAALLHRQAASMKRPFFFPVGHPSPSEAWPALWRRAASMDPFSAATVLSSTVVHSASRVPDPTIAFSAVPFAGYNSAYLRHLADQLGYLAASPRTVLAAGVAAEAIEELLGAAEEVDRTREGLRYTQDLPGGEGHEQLLPESKAHWPLEHRDDLLKVRALLGRTVYLRPSPALPGGASALAFLTPASGHGTAIARDMATQGVAIVDSILSQAALAELRQFCWESTVFHKAYIQGYVGAFLGDGLGATGVLHQVAAELIAALPEVLGGLRLVQAWIYKYDEMRTRGIDPHADAGKVSVNIWLTEDGANLEPGTGGLVFYDAEKPEDWSFDQGNSDTGSINTLLAGDPENARSNSNFRVGYRENRGLIFTGKIFHHTDSINFRPGYKNRRLNLTLMFS